MQLRILRAPETSVNVWHPQGFNSAIGRQMEVYSQAKEAVLQERAERGILKIMVADLHIYA